MRCQGYIPFATHFKHRPETSHQCTALPSPLKCFMSGIAFPLKINQTRPEPRIFIPLQILGHTGHDMENTLQRTSRRRREKVVYNSEFQSLLGTCTRPGPVTMLVPS